MNASLKVRELSNKHKQRYTTDSRVAGERLDIEMRAFPSGTTQALSSVRRHFWLLISGRCSGLVLGGWALTVNTRKNILHVQAPLRMPIKHISIISKLTMDKDKAEVNSMAMESFLPSQISIRVEIHASLKIKIIQYFHQI